MQTNCLSSKSLQRFASDFDEVPSKLLDGIVHDLNNIFTVILGSSEALTSEKSPDFKRRELAELIFEAASLGGNLSRRLLAISRSRTDELQPINAVKLSTGKGSILLVEEHELVRKHTNKNLQRLGYNVLVAPNAAEALAILERQSDIALLLTDVGTIGTMSGLELERVVAVRWPKMRFLFTFGNSGTIPSRNGRLCDRMPLLPKPYTKRDLAIKVRTALGVAP